MIYFLFWKCVCVGGGSAGPYPKKRTLCTGIFFCTPLVYSCGQSKSTNRLSGRELNVLTRFFQNWAPNLERLNILLWACHAMKNFEMWWTRSRRDGVYQKEAIAHFFRFFLLLLTISPNFQGTFPYMSFFSRTAQWIILKFGHELCLTSAHQFR